MSEIITPVIYQLGLGAVGGFIVICDQKVS
jgi:hypothetical protein